MMWQDIFQDVQSKLNEPSAIFSFAPVWIVSALLLVGAFAVAWLIHAIVLATLRRIFGDRRPYLSQVIAATKNPTRLALLLAALAIALPAAPAARNDRLFNDRIFSEQRPKAVRRSAPRMICRNGVIF